MEDHMDNKRELQLKDYGTVILTRRVTDDKESGMLNTYINFTDTKGKNITKELCENLVGMDKYELATSQEIKIGPSYGVNYLDSVYRTLKSNNHLDY